MTLSLNRVGSIWKRWSSRQRRQPQSFLAISFCTNNIFFLCPACCAPLCSSWHTTLVWPAASGGSSSPSPGSSQQVSEVLLLEKQSKFPRYNMKCIEENQIIHKILCVLSRFPHYISCYIAESRLPLGQCIRTNIVTFTVHTNGGEGGGGRGLDNR